jgi:hypothetical protein
MRCTFQPGSSALLLRCCSAAKKGAFMPTAKDTMALWMWPWMMAKAHLDFIETLIVAPKVVAARVPVMASAAQNPWLCDYGELTRMVTEKGDALGIAHDKITSASRKLQSASEANARDLGKLAGGAMLLPTDWFEMAERSYSAWAALVALPGEAIAPVHRRVTGNARRLRT